MESLQQKMVANGRGGYCFEHNSLLRAGLLALGFQVTGLIARVVRGMDAAAPAPAGHMTLRVDLPEGEYLADTGFGNLTPTAPLALRPDIEQATPHETMRLRRMGEEFLLEARTGRDWEHLYRLSPHPRLDMDYEVANWFTSTHPQSRFTNNLVASRALADRRVNLLNRRRTTYWRDGRVAEDELTDAEGLRRVLADDFGLEVDAEDAARLWGRLPAG